MENTKLADLKQTSSPSNKHTLSIGSFVKNMKNAITKLSRTISKPFKADSSISCNNSIEDLNKVTPINSNLTSKLEKLAHSIPINEESPQENKYSVIQKGILEDSLSPSSKFQDLAAQLEPIIKLTVGRKCLVLDLDETLVHSSFNVPVTNADFILELNLSSPVSNQSSVKMDMVYVSKRPGLDEFLIEVSQHFEIVVFTASLPTYANPVIDKLDPEGKYIHHRLFRESCLYLKGHFVKDLAILGHPLHEVIIVDNSPISYILQPQNAIAIPTWYSDPSDRYLSVLCSELVKISHPTASLLKMLPDINRILNENVHVLNSPSNDYSIVSNQISAILSILNSTTLFLSPQNVPGPTIHDPIHNIEPELEEENTNLRVLIDDLPQSDDLSGPNDLFQSSPLSQLGHLCDSDNSPYSDGQPCSVINTI